jgi:hypothetical protein
MMQKEMAVPPAPKDFGARDDRNVGLLVSRMRLHQRKHPSIVPSGTGRFF